MRRLLLAAAVVIAAGATESAHAYLKLGTLIDGAIVDARWRGPVRYFVSENGTDDASAAELRDAIARATRTWMAVETAQVRFEFQGMTSLLPEVGDGRTTIGFLDRPDLDQVLGSTSFLFDATTGEVVEADVFLNAHFAWSVSATGTPGRVDLESIALHELGHLLGLSHSAIGETDRAAGNGRPRVIASGAVMFPIAMLAGNVTERILHSDDIAGISDLYPTPDAGSGTGAIVGRVTRNAQGMPGAHIVAFNPETGVLVGSFALNTRGDFVIGRLPPGPYVLRVEPLDDADPESFFSVPIDVNFRVTYASRMVVAPAGGSSRSIEIQVASR